MAQKISRKVLRERLLELEGLAPDERSALLELLNKKRYGLVWKDRPEEAEEQLRTQLPVLEQDPDKTLLPGGDDAPNHLIIEGDNLHTLTALSYTHEDRVDVIYIDPPYNTGNKDFVYNDSFDVKGKNDAFMSTRQTLYIHLIKCPIGLSRSVSFPPSRLFLLRVSAMLKRA